MKIIFFQIVFVFSLPISLLAQESAKKDTLWKNGGQLTLTVSQASFSNWAAGGQNSYAGNTRLGLFSNYAKGNSSWENTLDLAYGLSKQQLQRDVRKNDDIIELNTKYGQKASKNWFYSALFNTKTQFSEGRKYLDGDTLYNVTSKFLAPLSISMAFGADYKPNENLSLFISPLNSKFLYVGDTLLSAINSLEPGKKTRYELGFISKFKFHKDIFENINLLTKVEIFADYLSINEVKDIDLSWEILLTIKVYKALSINVNTHLIWDNDVKTIDKNGGLGNPKLQFKEIVGAGLSYKF